MKFARYLEDTQTPEWKKAYIDYRGLKKRITAVRREQEGRPGHSSPEHSSGDDPLLPNPTEPNRLRQEGEGTGSDSAASPRPEEEEADAEDDSEDDRPRVLGIDHVTHQLMAPQQEPGQLQSTSQPNLVATDASILQRVSSDGTEPAPAHPVRRASTLRSFATRFRIPSFVGSNPDHISSKPRLVHSTTMPNNLSASEIGSVHHALPEYQPNKHTQTLREILPTLTPMQKKFFDKLDAELDKIESFYLDREKEAHERSDALKLQLHGLRDHRRAFYEAHPPSEAWTTAMSYLPFSLNRKADMTHAHVEAQSRADHLKHGRNPSASRSRTRRNASKQPLSPGRSNNHDTPGNSTPLTHASTSARPLHVQLANIMGWADAQDGSTLVGKGKQREKFDPEEYTHAKKKLKKAVLEHYRMLELLNDYRILNITGFRKALKKFEKVTKLAVQVPYMHEKVETSSFASDDSVKVMLHDMEEQFAARFSRGDKKKAMTRLRGGLKAQRSHHPSTFRSGMLLGLAIPAFVDGIVKSYQHDTRAQIPGWDGLLFVYSILLIPTLFACLVGVNISVWAKSRINYVFIFDLNVRTALNKHQYMELPLFLLATLLYTFYLSFARIGAGTIDPTTWPLIWLLFAVVVMINPLPIFRRSARYWLLRNFGRLLVSGTRRVEFADFWMGDQFCSLVFSLSNLYFIGCVYTGGHSGDIGTESVYAHTKHFWFGDKWRRCTTPGKGSSVWALPFIFAMLPLLVRFVQSVKRYADSKLLTHIINGGKYAMGIVYYACYYNWRHTGGEQGGVAFAFWVLFATVYACYAATWDYLMDWSLFKPHSRYPLLRPELLYSHKIVYYFAIVSNIVIRFIWVIYIPTGGPNFLIRSFIASFLEMLRRWQWNFIRLENEHLGNMDQYRVTREVPLPYSVDDIGEDSAGEDDMDEEAVSSKRSWRRKRSQSRAQETLEGNTNGAHA